MTGGRRACARARPGTPRPRSARRRSCRCRANIAHHSGFAARRWKSRSWNTSVAHTRSSSAPGSLVLGQRRRAARCDTASSAASIARIALGALLLLRSLLVAAHRRNHGRPCGPKLQQPVAQQVRRPAIVLVVVADACRARRRPASTASVRNARSSAPASTDLALARRHVEHLDVLDATARARRCGWPRARPCTGRRTSRRAAGRRAAPRACRAASSGA